MAILHKRTRQPGELISFAKKLLDESRKQSELSSINPNRVPSLNVSESEEDYLIELEAAGMDPEKFDLSISNRTLTIKGEKEQKPDEEREYLRTERSYGNFTREIQLPERADTEEVKADYERGILKVRVPKKPEARTKKIDVNIK